jgi:hypothetical protein
VVHVWSHAYTSLAVTRDGRVLAWGTVRLAHP